MRRHGDELRGLDRSDAARAEDCWVVDRDMPNWQPCPDGTIAPGEQRFSSGASIPWPTKRLKITDLLAGRDRTKGPSGSCGSNKPLVIETPVAGESVLAVRPALAAGQIGSRSFHDFGA